MTANPNTPRKQPTVTATMHNPATANTDSLPHAIRHLEAAIPGGIALHPDGGEACAIKMTRSGKPWMLDPWGHRGGPSRVTTAALAMAGYRVAVVPESRPLADEPTEEGKVAHAEALAAAGWNAPRMEAATGVDRKMCRRFLNEQEVTTGVLRRIMTLDPDDPIPYRSPSAAERMEDIEWLLDAGVSPEIVAKRAGLADIDTVAKQARKAGRHDIAARVDTEPAVGTDVPIRRRRRGRGKPTSVVGEAQVPTLEALRKLGSATIADLAAILPLTKQGIRHHLEVAERSGEVTRQTAGPGRAATYTVKEN